MCYLHQPKFSLTLRPVENIVDEPVEFCVSIEVSKMRVNKLGWAVVFIVVSITIVICYKTPSGHGQEIPLAQTEPTATPTATDSRDLSKYGSLDYSEAAGSQTQARFYANKRYDNQDWVYKVIVNPNTGGVGRVTDDPPQPLFPVETSSLIVVGEVTAVTAFLSNDRGSIYSEFAVRVNEVFKNALGKPLPKSLTVDRAGGVVVYPNGQRVLYSDSDKELPTPGTQYLFFLTKIDESPNFAILTSYEFRGNTIRQMEIGETFDTYKGMDRVSFLGRVRAKLSQVTQNQ